jgi:WXG100 family type VII secretion target
MAQQMGMDVEQVEQAAKQLQQQAAKIGEAVNQLNSVVSGLTAIWQGPDATRFVNDWWPKHKQALVAAQHEIEGLAQSARNNASEQRTTSSR